MRILWAADTLSVTSPSMRGAWYGLSTSIVAAIQIADETIFLTTFLVYAIVYTVYFTCFTIAGGFHVPLSIVSSGQ